MPHPYPAVACVNTAADFLQDDDIRGCSTSMGEFENEMVPNLNRRRSSPIPNTPTISQKTKRPKS
jgi:hypothetical protein